MKKLLWVVLSWIGGIILLIYGVGFLITGFPIFSGILLIISSLFVLPVTRNLIFRKIKKQPSLTQRSVVVCSLIAFSFIWIMFNIDKQVREENKKERTEQELIKKEKQEAQKEIFLKEKQNFLKEKQDIVKQLTGFYDQKKYKDGLQLAAKYTKFQDSDINSITEKMKNEMRTQDLLKIVTTTKKDNYAVLKEIYTELVELNPTNAKYKDSLKDYTEKSQIVVEDDLLPKGIHYEGQNNDPTVSGMIRLVKDKLTKDAINAESVQFQKVFYANQNDMTAICGEINIVKSSGQSGYRRFISNGIVDTAIDGHSKNFNELWNQVCKH